MKKIILITLGLIIGVFILTFMPNEFEIFGIKFWGVREANAQREVFEQSQSYIDGKRQDLIRYRHDWLLSKDSTDKKAIESLVRSSFANFDKTKIIDSDQYEFLEYCLKK